MLEEDVQVVGLGAVVWMDSYAVGRLQAAESMG